MNTSDDKYYICDKCNNQMEIIQTHTAIKTRHETIIEYLLYCFNCQNEKIKKRIIKT